MARGGGDAVLYRMARAETLKIAHLDSFLAVYHLASGITHLITSPAPEILAMLGEAGMTRSALMERLGDAYALGGADAAVLEERLEELVASGLVAVA